LRESKCEWPITIEVNTPTPSHSDSQGHTLTYICKFTLPVYNVKHINYIS